MRNVPTLGLLAALIVLAATTPAAPASTVDKQKLMDPAALNEKAPDTYRARFATSKGTWSSKSRAPGRLSAPTASTTW